MPISTLEIDATPKTPHTAVPGLLRADPGVRVNLRAKLAMRR